MLYNRFRAILILIKVTPKNLFDLKEAELVDVLGE